MESSNINEVLPNPFLLRMAMLFSAEPQLAGVQQGTMGNRIASQIASPVPLWVVGYIGDFPFPLKGYGLADAIRRGLDLLSGEYHVRPTGTSSGSKSVLSNRNRKNRNRFIETGEVVNSRCLEKRGSALHF